MTRLFPYFASAARMAALVLPLAGLMALPATAQYHIQNDYPTVAVADYVLACMVANGQTRQALERCSCSIDVISTLLTYEDYVEAETVLGVGQVTGQSAEYFRANSRFEDMVAKLRQAQAEAEMQCF
ncbi:MAG TPA: hypothetical protein VKY54_06480 [Kiloniellales bacterium]|jgi:lysyl-tRNA synthetase class II|nr:hypothetical protein [Kiloniellales bacterium]